MHFYPILLVQADSLEEAKAKAEDFCGGESGERAWFDYGGVVADNGTRFNKPFSEVREYLPPDNHAEEALRFICQGEQELRNQRFTQAGCYYRKAGNLLTQAFCTEYPLFNIDYNDYRRDCGEGWYAIEADFHF
jgi:hypothetical protein